MQIEKIIPGGQSLATDKNGKKIFFWNALPGETVVEYETTKTKSSYIEAIATTIINPSESRVNPLDDCYLSTSPWQIMDYDYELVQKSFLVQEIFRQHGIPIDAPAVVTDGHAYHYRNKMEYALYYDHADELIHLAFHARGSHRKVPIESSSIERPEILERAQEIVADLNRHHADARKYQSLLLRASQSGEVSGGLFENHQPHPHFDNLADTILGHAYSYSPNGFFQINVPVYELALQEIQRHIHTDEVLDLYAGVGTIGLSVARDRHLTLVELNSSAFAEMQRNIMNAFNSNPDADSKLHDTPLRPSGSTSATSIEHGNIHGYLSASEDALDFIKPSQTVILDPPRAGIDAKLIDKLLDVTPETIIYLSCNPATQARDIKLLSSQYNLDAVTAFNFFPRTPHIESLALCPRK